MGIIKRQSTKTLIVNLIGSIIGAIAVLFIYSSNDEIYGYANWLYSTATLLIPLASLGVLSLVLKYYPAYQESDRSRFNGFLSLISLLLGGSFILFLLIWKFLTPVFYKLLKSNNMNYELFQDYEIYLLILLFLFILLRFLTNQSANRLRIVMPNLIQQFGYKLFLPLWVLAYAFYGFGQVAFSWGIILFFAAASLTLIIYLVYLKALNFGKISKPSKDFSYKEMTSYSVFGILNQIGTGLSMRVDSVMIPIMLGSTALNSYYVKAYFIANFIEMPTRAINQIASPIISKAWQKNDLQEISSVYKKASSNLLLVGFFIFLGLWYCLDDLVSISSDPKSFPHVRTIFLLIGAAKLIDMVTSVNTHIITFSKLFKYNLIFILFLGSFNLLLNLKLIVSHGIVGAAMASAIAMLLYNVIKLIFIWRKYSLLPFTLGNLKSLTLSSVLFALYFFIDFSFHPVVNILLKASFVSIIYLPIAYFWKISEEANETIDSYIKHLVKKNGI